jgi:hypothetical protein
MEHGLSSTVPFLKNPQSLLDDGRKGGLYWT